MMDNMPTKKTTINVRVPVYIFVKDGIHVAYTPMLELSSYGKSVDDAKKAFEEAVEIFFEETQEKGTLEKVLLQLGWQLQQKPKAVYKEPPISKSLSARLQKKAPKTIYQERIKIPVTS